MATHDIALLIVVSASGWLFLVLYTAVYNWWEEEAGGHIFTFSFSITTLATWAVVVSIWPDLPGRDAIRTTLLAVLAICSLWRLIMFIRTWLRGRRRMREGRARGEALRYDAQ